MEGLDRVDAKQQEEIETLKKTDVKHDIQIEKEKDLLEFIAIAMLIMLFFSILNWVCLTGLFWLKLK